jgi:hypothetical protein
VAPLEMNAGTCWGKNTIDPRGRSVEKPREVTLTFNLFMLRTVCLFRWGTYFILFCFILFYFSNLSVLCFEWFAVYFIIYFISLFLFRIQILIPTLEN